MKYYRRGKANLQDDAYKDIMDVLEKELAKLPPEEQVEKAQKLIKGFGSKLPKVIDQMKVDIIKQSRKDVRKAVKFDDKQRRKFEKRLYEKHKELINKYEELLGICLEGTQSHRDIMHAALGEKDNVFPLLLRLHARAYRIANEILSLVRSGYGTGALARWRAMHELVVVMSYLRDKGPKATKVFEDHGAVSGYKAMKVYQQHCEQLGQKPFTAYEVRLAKSKYERRIRRYGRNFKNDYGWAYYVSNGAISNFKDLEQYTGIDHLRPYYRMASLGIHSEWSSLTTGEEFEALNNPGVVLVGPADYGFEDAVSLSLITLSHATILVLTYNYAIKSLVYAKVIQQTEQDAQDILEKAVLDKKSKH